MLYLWKQYSAQIITGRVDSCRFRSVQDTTHACHGWSRSLTSIWKTKAQLSINARSIYRFCLGDLIRTYTCTPSETSWSLRQECEPSLWKAYTNRTESTEGTTWHRGIVKIDAYGNFISGKGSKQERFTISSYRADRGISNVGMVSILSCTCCMHHQTSSNIDLILCIKHLFSIAVM